MGQHYPGMTVYRVPETAPPAGKWLLRSLELSTVAICLVVGLMLWKADELSPRILLVGAILSGALVVAAVVLGMVVSVLHGQQEYERSVELVLTEDQLVRRRQGWPEVAIPRAEISSVSEFPRGLRVAGGGSVILVPRAVAGYEELRGEILRGRELAPPAKRSPIPSVLSTIVLVAGWIIALASTKPNVVIVLGTTVFLWQAWVTLRLWRQLRRLRPPRAAAVALGLLVGLLACAFALLLHYHRIGGV